MSTVADVVVIGAGFYGAVIAADLAERGHDVVLVDREDRLLARASTLNQARVHGGYHYPRSVATGLGSRRNYRRFVEEFADAVVSPRTALYAVARTGSWTTAGQFEGFCRRIGAPCRRADDQWRRLFSRPLVAEVFEVEEALFDAQAVAATLEQRLARAGVDVRLRTEVRGIEHDGDGVSLLTADGSPLRAAAAVNCTYSELNDLTGDETPIALQHEWTEIAICRPPEPLRDVAVTLVDGPFFSLLPFPPAGPGASTLSHVRYTPHAQWGLGAADAAPTCPEVPSRSRFGSMLRDAQRYLPALAGTTLERSAFEIKTVPARREGDDGRPIVFRAARAGDPPVASVLGSKLDLVYDVLPRVETFVQETGALVRR